MNTWILAPLGVALFCLLVTWFVNRRPRLTGVLWPKGMVLSGSIERPDVAYDGDIVLGTEGKFGTIRCRRLLVARGSEVSVRRIEAARVRVDGKLAGVRTLAVGSRLEVNGELKAEDLQCPKIVLTAGSRSMVVTVTGAHKIVRHPKAEVKGFFEDVNEMVDAGVIKRNAGAADDTEQVTALQ